MIIELSSVFFIKNVNAVVLNNTISQTGEIRTNGSGIGTWNNHVDFDSFLYNANVTITEIQMSFYLISDDYVSNTWSWTDSVICAKNGSTPNWIALPYVEFNSTESGANINVFSLSNDTDRNLGYFCSWISFSIEVTTYQTSQLCTFHVTFSISYQAIYLENIEPPLLDDLLQMIPIFVILFVLPIVLYYTFGKMGFGIGLIFSTIIAFFSNMIAIEYFIILLLSEITIVYLIMKKEKEV